jgi:ferrochelatase
MSLKDYQALLLVSFGGPEGPDDVLPFLGNVLHGKRVPQERVLEVAKHYERFGGVSPINAQNRALKTALEREFAAAELSLPIFLGNRNWHPFLAEALAEMRNRGIGRALAFVTSAFSSYSSCRQYLENIAAAQKEVGGAAPEVDKLRAYFNHPGFIEAWTDRVRDALARMSVQDPSTVRLAFTAHSIPRDMADRCQYQAQLLEASRLVAKAAGIPNERWRLVYQSRSGPPTQPWLEPDINDHLVELKSAGALSVIAVPIGFMSDHIEVLYDLDTEARQTADNLGLKLERAGTVSAHPRFVSMIRELVVERLKSDADRPALGTMGASHDVCPADCCPSGR